MNYIVSCLPNTKIVESVLYDDGVFQNANAGTIMCDTSTISPLASKDFNKSSIEHGMLYMDTPMSGGVMGAEKQTLSFMVGSNSEEDFEKASVVLKGMGKNLFNCGGPGTGSIAKLSNNLILGI